MEQLADQQISQRVDTEIIDCGRLGDLVWDGSVSADKLVAQGETSGATISEAIRRLEEFYVPADLEAKTRCIDGRHDPQLNEDDLGP